MFGKLKFVWSVNGALIELGISPAAFDKTYYNGILQLASAGKLTGEEVATFLFYQLGIGMKPLHGETIIQRWITSGKVDPEIVREAQRAKVANPLSDSFEASRGALSP